MKDGTMSKQLAQRVSVDSEKLLRLPALRIMQGEGRYIYAFAVDGKRISDFATVSRIRRNAEQTIEGYQRPESLAHIEGIRAYLESEAPLLPNAVVMAFDERVRFAPLGESPSIAYAQQGELLVPFSQDMSDEEKPGFIVDGQQRLAAIRDADIDSFPVCVSAFITGDVREQIEQFILVNSTKPLPKGLIYELLPSTGSRLPALLQRRRFPAMVLERLNLDTDSPFKGLINTATTPKGIVKDNSILKMVENSMSDGFLFRFRELDGGGDALETALVIYKGFWRAVAEVFPNAWGLRPKHSRLLHGAGIVSMGYLMESIIERHREAGLAGQDVFKADLNAMKDSFRWTDGIWDFGPGSQRKWNEIQNTHADIDILTNYLYYQYKARVWDAPKAVGN